MGIELSSELQEWLRKNRSKAIQAGVDTDFNRRNFQVTRKSAGPAIEGAPPGAANVEGP